MPPMRAPGALLLLLSAVVGYSRPALADPEAVVSFSIATDTIAECDRGLNRTGINATLQQRRLASTAEPAPWQTLGVVHIAAASPENNSCQQQNFNFTLNSSTAGMAQFRLVQWEHGGGHCNCWGIVPNSWTVKIGEAAIQRDPPQYCAMTGYTFGTELCNRNLSLFCSGSASVPRGFLSPPLRLGAGGKDSNEVAEWKSCPVDAGEVIETQGKLSDCTGVDSKIEVQFRLDFSLGGNCDSPESAEKGVEFSLLGADGRWVPLGYYLHDHTRRNGIRIGEFLTLSSVGIRGYQVPAYQVNNSINATVVICDPAHLQQSHTQFCWLETSQHSRNQCAPVDVWGLDDVLIIAKSSNESEQVLLDDSFDSHSQLNESNWKPIRNGNLSNPSECGRNGGERLLFYGTGPWTQERGGGTSRIVSRLVTTMPLPLDGIVVVKQPQATTTMSPMTTPTTPPVTIPIAPDTTPTKDADDLELRMQLQNMQKEILQKVTAEEILTAALQSDDPEEAADILLDVTSNGTLTDPLVAVYLLGTVVEKFSQLPLGSGETTPPLEGSGTPSPLEGSRTPGSGIADLEEDVDEFTEELFAIGSNIITMEASLEKGEVSGDSINIIGSTMLRIMEAIAFTVFSLDEGTASGKHINLMARRESGPPPPRNASINGSNEPVAFSPRNDYKIRVPREQLGRFPEMSQDEDGRTRVISFLFTNVSGIFPGQLPNIQTGVSSFLASNILSASLECRDEACPTGDADDSLNNTITITIVHSDTVQGSISDDTSDANISCVFWDFLTDEGVLSIGEWNKKGCWRNETLSNDSVTVCECNHLTNFAILLSASPIPTSAINALALNVIGDVGVAISLAAMAITIFTFIALKALRTMRNYIHINLCINLGIAQIVFISGIDMVGGDDTAVPAHCQAVAVLVHYFFLVSFMWMLMEGVVLYVVLVKVFVKRKKLYMLAFTVVSYGAPLLYLGLLTLPIGYALSDAMPSYGYEDACFLNPKTYFMWAFIAPVILILLVNCGFFIMAASIMWRHQKKQSDTKKLYQIRSWLRSAVSLVVIMGLTWIVGVVIVEREELLPVAYIYTIMVAFQGFFIFIIFVPLSKQVREAYSKWWRTKVNESDFLSKYFGEKITTSTSVSKSKPVDGTFPRGAGKYTLPNSTAPMDCLMLSKKTVPLTPTTPTSSVASPEGVGPTAPTASFNSFMSPVDMPILDEVTVTQRERAGTLSRPNSQLPHPQANSQYKVGGRPGTKHWGALRNNIKEGTLFKVVYSSSYFKPSREGVAPDGTENGEMVITNTHAITS